jgi:hypothetical protein
MKKVIFLSILISLVAISCKKKKDSPAVESNVNYTGSATYALVSKDKSTQTFGGSSIYISTNTYTYDVNLVRKSIHTDSTFSGSNWMVNSYTITYNYNGSNKWSSTHTVYSTSSTVDVNYTYDTNGKIQFEITNNQGAIDTLVYTHTGSKTTRKPKQISLSNHSEEYYTNGDIDSTLSFVGVSVNSRQKYTYHSSNINKTFLSWAAAMPLSPASKEILNTTYTSSGTTFTTVFTYTKNSDGYPLSMTETTSGQTFTIFYAYL